MPGNRRVVRADRRPGEAQRHLNLRGRIHRGAVPGQDGIEAGAERVNQLDVARGGLRASGAEAHLGVGDGRDNDALVTQHRLLQALQHRFRLLAHDERADVGVEHIDLVHRLNRPSLLTTSSRSAIKSGSAFSSCANEPQVGRMGRRMMLSPSLTISSSLTPSKSRSRGRRMARLLPFLKMDTVLIISSWPTGLYHYVQYMKMSGIWICLTYVLFFLFSRKAVKSDLDWLIIWKGERDTAGRSSGQNTGGNGRSALSEERTYPYKAYHPEIEVPPKGKHSQTF